MRLVSVTFRGYRRFLGTRVNLDAPVVSLVGPNQAGKSSLLDALQRLMDGEPFEERDRNRTSPPPDDTYILEALFRVETADREALFDVPGGPGVQFFRLYRPARGGRLYATEPRLRRPRALRIRLAQLLAEAGNSRWLEQLGEGTSGAADGDDAPATLPDRFREVAGLLKAAGEDLDGSTLESLVSLADELGRGSTKSVRTRIEGLLRRVAGVEGTTHPHQAAINALTNRLPKIVEYDEDDRDLRAEYDLGDSGEWNSAIRNLASLAGTSVDELANTRGDAAKSKNVLEPANARLQAFFSQYWSQAPITVSLHIVQDRLEVLTLRRPTKWSSIGESSDGMRAFVALLAYSQQLPTDPRPMLLVDEAERHLHYDAQADLVRVFEQQTAAGQIIYTTHSLGCLPQDLGRGLRAVEPLPDTDESRVVNAVWDLGEGISPLIRAIGASALALVAARYAVFAEGGTEATLLPTLLREANGVSNLPYQIVPGLAGASGAGISRVALDAVHLAYLVDGDKSGKDREKFLAKQGVQPDRIVVLGGRWSGMTIEDLVVPDLYVQAVTAELAERHGVAPIVTAASLPPLGRARHVDSLCKARGIELSHTAVVARLLEEASPLVSKQALKVLKSLHTELLSTLAIGAVTK